MKKWVAVFALAIVFVMTGATALATTGDPVLINEVLASHSGTDDTEFVEFFGTPGASLDGLSIISVESEDIASQGSIDWRVDFGPTDLIGANGYFLVGNPDGLSANYGVMPNLSTGANILENSSLTLALVETSSIVGTAVTGAEVVRDAVALSDGGAGDLFYFDAPVIGPDGIYFPAGARRIVDGVDTDTAVDWDLADFYLGPDNTPTPSDTPYVRDPVFINEVLASHTGTDNTEFVELYGASGTSLHRLSLIVVESDDNSNLGQFILRIDFGSTDRIGCKFFLVGNPNGLASNYGVSPNLEIGNNSLQNNSLTIALVETESIRGNSVSGDESVLDAVALSDGGPTDVFFFGAPVIGPDGDYFPAGARRVEDGVDTDSENDWVISDFYLGSENTPASSEVGNVDVHPGSCPNSVNPRNNGVIPVAILSDPMFDATTVDPTTLAFGPDGAEPVHGNGHIEDVDGDGDDDLVLHFQTRATGITCGDSQATLVGYTYDGESYQGSDSIKTSGCR